MSAVDEGGRHIGQKAGGLGRFHLNKFQIQLVFGDVAHLRQVAGLGVNGNQAGGFQHLQSASSVGGVVGQGNLIALFQFIH